MKHKITLHKSIAANKKKLEDINAKIEALVVKRNAAEESLRLNISKSTFDCSCEVSSKLCDIELIEEQYNFSTDYSSNYNGDTTHQTRYYFFCPSCTIYQEIIDVCKWTKPGEDIFNDIRPFTDRFNHIKKYFKCVYVWDSQSTRASGRVLELHEPYWARMEERKKKQEQDRRIAEAKRVLKEAGEL